MFYTLGGKKTASGFYSISLTTAGTFPIILAESGPDSHGLRMGHIVYNETSSLLDQLLITCSAWTDTIPNNRSGCTERMISPKIILMPFLEIEEIDAEQANIFDIWQA